MPSIASVSNILLYFLAPPKALEFDARGMANLLANFLNLVSPHNFAPKISSPGRKSGLSPDTLGMTQIRF